MSKALRSSKKQPAFDPSELEDLIHTPAVGTGVGSHLMGGPQIVDINDTSTVDRFVEHDDLSRVKWKSSTPTSLTGPPATQAGGGNLSTVVNTHMTTVMQQPLKPSAVAQETSPSMPGLNSATENPTQVKLWITEHGDVVPESRVKRIRLAQDVINSAEESIYDTLWASKTVQSDARDSSRVVQAGYDYLVKRTRLSKRTVQRIIEKLIEKDFIAIERPADIYQRTSTVYRVFGYKAILDRHIQKGRSHVAKLGPGFSYVRPLGDSMERLRAQHTSNMSTVVKTEPPTVAENNVSTAVNPTTETVGETDMSTVACVSTTYIGKDGLEQSTSSSGIPAALNQYGAVDDDVTGRLIRACKQQAPDCTEEEIIHFIHEKGSLVKKRDSRIYSPIGFLVTAVPKCLTGEAFKLFREQQIKQRDDESAYEAQRKEELEEWRREQEAQLADPSVSAEDKQFIRECLGI